MDDLISRQAAIDALCDNCDHAQSVCPHYPCKQYAVINALLPVHPEQKKGKWVMRWHNFFHTEVPICSQCLEFSPLKYDFCPKCGADMREEEQDG